MSKQARPILHYNSKSFTVTQILKSVHTCIYENQLVKSGFRWLIGIEKTIPMKKSNIDEFKKATIPLKMLMLDEMYKTFKDIALNDCKSIPGLTAKFKSLSKKEKADAINEMHRRISSAMEILNQHVRKMCAEMEKMINVLESEWASKSKSDFWTDWPGRN